MTLLALRGTPALTPSVAGPFLRGPGLVWAALFANVLSFQRIPLLVPIPGPVGQALAQGALPLAFGLVLLANPRGVLRPNLFLSLLSVMVLLALIVSIHNTFAFGSSYRALRLTAFVAVLWMLTAWWGEPGLPLLRAHLLCLKVVTASVLFGLVVAPGKALAFQGRLSGILWPIPPTQVAHYAAVALGCTAVLWFCGQATGRSTVITVGAGAVAIVESHTRTALLALFVGLVIAGASLFMGHVRVRRTAAVIAVLGAFVAAFFAPLIVSWASRGQTAQEASQLTGRTKVWSQVLDLPRQWPQRWFGTGLSNKSFNGLPIDSNWVATYYDQGWAAVVLQVTVLLTLVLVAVTRPRGPRRAIALFLVAYCIVASFTETGLGDASPYLLDLTVAASLLALPARRPVP